MDQHSKDAISRIRSKLKDMRAHKLAPKDEPAPPEAPKEGAEHKPAMLEVTVEKHSLAPAHDEAAETSAEETAEPSEAKEQEPSSEEPKDHLPDVTSKALAILRGLKPPKKKA